MEACLSIKFAYLDWLTCKKCLLGGHGKARRNVNINILLGRGLCTFSNKTKRGHQFFVISVTGGQRFCFGLMINLASPRHSINIEWSLMLKFFERSEFFVIQWNPVNTVTDEPK